ncbi:MAG TPA: glutamate formimidoyltransferase [Nitrospiraceae bacterium]|nr:glutamate formimidoyltransferase [Nitrospiraceae bacterium]
MEQIVECVPNFSEGRKAEIVDALVAAVRAVPDVFLLDQEMDADHHRSVLTFAGPPDSVAEAAFQCTRIATARIDLRQHQGGHPRIGATDVIPFVPIRGVTMEDCVGLAKCLGARIGRELHLPVFLYERAALHPERTNLEVIRRGGLEGLASRMEAEAMWTPDFGPSQLHPSAGATVVGARPPLIAYNVNLRTDNIGLAKRIAKTVRFSSGGLPSVKAIGVELSSRRLVQVSMNLTNYEETPIDVAFEAVQREAEQHGVQLAGSEIIGLIPRDALIHAAESCLQLERFDRSQVLETRLETVMGRKSAAQDNHSRDLSESVSSFLAAVSDGTPTPGGGSVAALAGALAASLGVMACRIGPPSRKAGSAEGSQDAAQSKELTKELEASEHRLQALASALKKLVQADADAYAAVVKAYRMPKIDPSRPAAISDNLRTATLVPLKTAELTNDVAALLLALRQKAKSSVSSDLRVGLLMSIAAMEAGLENVSVNVKHLKDQALEREMAGRIRIIEQSLVELRRLC